MPLSFCCRFVIPLCVTRVILCVHVRVHNVDQFKFSNELGNIEHKVESLIVEDIDKHDFLPPLPAKETDVLTGTQLLANI